MQMLHQPETCALAKLCDQGARQPLQLPQEVCQHTCRRLDRVRLSSHVLSLAHLLAFIQTRPPSCGAFQEPAGSEPAPGKESEETPLFKAFAAIKLHELKGTGQKADQAFAAAIKLAMSDVAANAAFQPV